MCKEIAYFEDTIMKLHIKMYLSSMGQKSILKFS